MRRLGKMKMRGIANCLLDYKKSFTKLPVGYLLVYDDEDMVLGCYKNNYYFSFSELQTNVYQMTIKSISDDKKWSVYETYIFKPKMSNEGYMIVDIHTGEYYTTKEKNV